MQAHWETETNEAARRPSRDLALAHLGVVDDITVDLTAEGGFDDGCGGGYWCPACRAEAKAEAFLWLHALSEAHQMAPLLHTA